MGSLLKCVFMFYGYELIYLISNSVLISLPISFNNKLHSYVCFLQVHQNAFFPLVNFILHEKGKSFVMV